MLESLEKLRGYAPKNVPGVRSEILIIADAIQAEVDEKYMLLPVDADGALIHIGDYVHEVDDNIPMTVMSITYYEDCVDVNSCGMNPNLLRHVKPRTVHDVLQDFREACHRAEREHGEHTQMYDMAMAKAFKDAKDELRMKGGAE